MTTPAAPTSAPQPREASAEHSELVVRRDHRRAVRTVLAMLGGAAALLFWLPALIVLIRHEPGYFTSGIMWTALIATIVLMAVGLGATLLWQRTGSRRTPLVTVDSHGVRIPARGKRPALDAAWDDLVLVRLVGRLDPELVFYAKPDEPDAEQSVEQVAQADLSEPEFLRPLDFENDPPPLMQAPERAVFGDIAPVPEPEPIDDVPPPPRPKGDPLYATPYVVAVGRTEPPLREVLREIRRFAGGRVALD